MAKPYLDACCFIYLVEGEPAWQQSVKDTLEAFGPSAVFVTSELSRLECRTKPMRDNNPALLARYDALFAATRMEIVPLSTAVVDRATELRAKYGFKSPDALHLAAAIESGASVFVTGDDKLERCGELKMEILQSSAA